MKTRKKIAALLLISLLGCGDDVIVNPTIDPSPSPTPDPCVPTRADINVSVKGNPGATSWSLGQVATFTVFLRFEETDPVLTAGCPQLNRATWRFLHNDDPLCSFAGNLDASTIRVVCLTPGWGLIEAVPNGFDVDTATFSFKVLEPEA
jgi:hypothetical protein